MLGNTVKKTMAIMGRKRRSFHPAPSLQPPALDPHDPQITRRLCPGFGRAHGTQQWDYTQGNQGTISNAAMG